MYPRHQRHIQTQACHLPCPGDSQIDFPPLPYWIPGCLVPATGRKAASGKLKTLLTERDSAPAVFQHSVLHLSRLSGCARTNRTSNKQRIKMKHAADTCGHSALQPQQLRHLQLLCSACHRALIFSNLPQGCPGDTFLQKTRLADRQTHLRCNSSAQMRIDTFNTPAAILARKV